MQVERRSFLVNAESQHGKPLSRILRMAKKEEENVPGTGQDDPAKGSAMMDLISGLQGKKDEDDDTEGGSTGTGESKSKGRKKKKKKKKKKTKIKRKRRKDRYESQNFLLRIEGTLCCASIVVAVIYLTSLFVVMLVCGIWSNFDFTATMDSVKVKAF